MLSADCTGNHCDERWLLYSCKAIADLLESGQLVCKSPLVLNLSVTGCRLKLLCGCNDTFVAVSEGSIRALAGEQVVKSTTANRRQLAIERQSLRFGQLPRPA